MVTTDVAGRGLDIKGLAYVVNYDMPASIDTCAYIRRPSPRASRSAGWG
jgi:superfamily II DNA/RNA helicase